MAHKTIALTTELREPRIFRSPCNLLHAQALHVNCPDIAVPTHKHSWQNMLSLWNFQAPLLAATRSTARGFEPLRAEPNGFLVHHLSHSVTLSCCPASSCKTVPSKQLLSVLWHIAHWLRRHYRCGIDTRDRTHNLCRRPCSVATTLLVCPPAEFQGSSFHPTSYATSSLPSQPKT